MLYAIVCYILFLFCVDAVFGRNKVVYINDFRNRSVRTVGIAYSLAFLSLAVIFFISK